MGTALLQKQKITHLGFYATNFAPDGIKIGRDFDNLMEIQKPPMDDPPLVFEEWSEDLSNFGGGWSTDARVCIQHESPYPVAIDALVVAVDTNEKNMEK